MIDAYSAIKSSFFVEAYDERSANCEIIELHGETVLCTIQDSPFKLKEFVQQSSQELLSSPSELLSVIISEFNFKSGFFYSMFVIDQKSSMLTYVCSNDAMIMIKDTRGELVELKSDLQQINTYPLSKIMTLFSSNSNLADVIFQKSYKDAFCKKDVLKVITDLNEELLYLDRFSFIFLNNQIGKNIDAKANYNIEASIESIAKTEESVELFLESYFKGSMQNARTLLVVNELLMNAYEHGVLQIEPETKNNYMLKGSYEEYLSKLEEEKKGRISLDIVLYKNSVLQVSIDDFGEGFDMKSASLDKNAEYRGRGISLSHRTTDSLFYENGGSRSVFFINYKLKKSRPKLPSYLSMEDVLRTTTILYVEDDPIIRSILERALGKKIGTLLTAENGAEGLEIFKQNSVDMVISDLNMPVLNGINMSKSIRKIDKDIPILITTGMGGDENIADAIKVNVNKFLQKPIDFNKVKEDIEYYATLSYLKKHSDTSKEENDIRSKARYKEEQERQAYIKQKLIMHNDSPKIQSAFAEVFHKPLETLSGDIYGIYSLEEKKSLLFIADCMGKGLVASVTSVIAAAFLDRAIDVSKQKGGFDLYRTCHDFVNFIQKYLLDEETISFSIVHIDENRGELSYISYGMYPVLLVDFEKKSSKYLKNTNPPLLKGENGCKIETLSLPESFRIVAFTDGACDFDGFNYKELLVNFASLSSSESISEWFSEFVSVYEDRVDDDITILSFASKHMS
ncbi:MAG: response regulator [Campylobacterales bacterium]